MALILGGGLWSRGMLRLHMHLPSLGTNLRVVRARLMHLVIAMGSLCFLQVSFFWGALQRLGVLGAPLGPRYAEWRVLWRALPFSKGPQMTPTALGQLLGQAGRDWDDKH